MIVCVCCRLLNGHCPRAGAVESPPLKKPPYVKKPLNAFMLFMKEMRPKVIEECTLKESAAINQILGRKVSVRVISAALAATVWHRLRHVTVTGVRTSMFRNLKQKSTLSHFTS